MLCSKPMLRSYGAPISAACDRHRNLQGTNHAAVQQTSSEGDLLVIGGTVVLEVSIFDGPVAHRTGGCVQLLSLDVFSTLLDGRLTPILGFIQQL